MPTDLAFESFYRTHHAGLVALAAAVSGSRLFADDLAQEALVVVHQRWDQVAGYDDPGAWARRVLVNKAISRRRRETLEQKGASELEALHPGNAVASPPENDQEIWAAVAELPDHQRIAVALHYLEGHDAASIGRVLDCAASTARVHLHRGRRSLATRLASEEV